MYDLICLLICFFCVVLFVVLCIVGVIVIVIDVVVNFGNVVIGVYWQVDDDYVDGIVVNDCINGLVILVQQFFVLIWCDGY